MTGIVWVNNPLFTSIQIMNFLVLLSEASTRLALNHSAIYLAMQTTIPIISFSLTIIITEILQQNITNKAIKYYKMI